MLFRRKNTGRRDDRIWATEDAKFEGICDQVVRTTQTGASVLVIAHFRDTLEKTTAALERRGVKFETVEDRWQMAEFDLASLAEAQVVSLLSELVVGQKHSGSMTRREPSPGKRLQAIVVEHHPTPEVDNEVLSFLEGLPRGSTIRFHSSLDEPLLKAFGADRTLGLLSKLGWEKTGYMESPTITRAIASGQTRIKEVAVSNEKVNSQREWLYYNCPTLRDRMK